MHIASLSVLFRSLLGDDELQKGTPILKTSSIM